MAQADFSCWVPPLPQRLKIHKSGLFARPARLESPRAWVWPRRFSPCDRRAKTRKAYPQLHLAARL